MLRQLLLIAIASFVSLAATARVAEFDYKLKNRDSCNDQLEAIQAQWEHKHEQARAALEKVRKITLEHIVSEQDSVQFRENCKNPKIAETDKMREFGAAIGGKKGWHSFSQALLDELNKKNFQVRSFNTSKIPIEQIWGTYQDQGMRAEYDLCEDKFNYLIGVLYNGKTVFMEPQDYCAAQLPRSCFESISGSDKDVFGYLELNGVFSPESNRHPQLPKTAKIDGEHVDSRSQDAVNDVNR